jgi:NAD(P)-dependent dehydrogenase (short-subunit alcohol dehydrogenase family)
MASKVAFVTGAASGIGRATVDELLDAGWKVALADRDATAVQKVADELSPKHQVIALGVDVTDEKAVAGAIAETVRALGGLDGVVNSAGIAADVPALETSVELFRRILDINVTGTFIVAQAAARVMQKRGGGAIVNLASIAGLRGSKGRSAYGTSKGAVCTLTQVLANDLARHGIRVNAVAPGPIDTPMVKAMHTDADRVLWRRYIPMRRYGAPQEIAKAIAFLLDGEKAGYITGEILAVDGGFRGAGVIADD